MSAAKKWNRGTLIERLYNETPDASLSVEAGAEIQRLRAELEVALRAPVQPAELVPCGCAAVGGCVTRLKLPDGEFCKASCFSHSDVAALNAPVQAPAMALSELPPLPQFFALGKTRINGEEHGHYSAKQMQDYARAALAQAPQSDDALDAARYRHMRDQSNSLESKQRDSGASSNITCYQSVEGIRELKHGAELDFAIDAAIAALTGSATTGCNAGEGDA